MLAENRDGGQTDLPASPKALKDNMVQDRSIYLQNCKKKKKNQSCVGTPTNGFCNCTIKLGLSPNFQSAKLFYPLRARQACPWPALKQAKLAFFSGSLVSQCYLFK